MNYADCPPHPAWMEPAEWLGGDLARQFPLHLLTSQPRHRLHSQLDPGPVSRAAKVAGREALSLNPADAARRGIADGDLVRVWNGRGECLAGARLTADLRPGVAVLPTGAWFDPAEPGRSGSLERHGNPNVLTRDKGTSSLGQGPSALTVLVEVERYAGEPPPVGVFEAPATVAS
jgi:biotin/methionine sulfoxide reductase